MLRGLRQAHSLNFLCLEPFMGFPLKRTKCPCRYVHVCFVACGRFHGGDSFSPFVSVVVRFGSRVSFSAAVSVGVLCLCGCGRGWVCVRLGVRVHVRVCVLVVFDPVPDAAFSTFCSAWCTFLFIFSGTQQPIRTCQPLFST